MASADAGALAPPLRSAGGLRLFPALEKNPSVVSFAQTLGGKAALAASFAVLAGVTDKPAAVAGAVVAVFFPARRRWIVAAFSVAMVLVTRRLDPVLGPGAAPAYKAAVLLTALALTVGFVQLAKTRPGGALSKRPVATLVTLHLLLAGLVWQLPLSGGARLAGWALVAGLGSYLWYAAYALKEGRQRRGGALLLDAGAWRPFWGGTHTPFPKPGGWLEKLEVRDATEAAVWQLKAVKLLAWALVLSVVRAVVVRVATSSGSYPSAWLCGAAPVPAAWVEALGLPGLSIPSLQDALAHSLAGQPDPPASNWAALGLHLVVDLLDISIFGHVAVAGARMAGFKALRNTHRPLESRSIADFWNRYYFYFKELLVDFFFFPAYLRFFKRRPRLRLFFATFAAAGFGNFLYHYLAGTGELARRGLLGALSDRRAYALYAVLLALGIGLSQLGGTARGPSRSPWVRGATVSGVLLFYALLAIPNTAPLGATEGDCWRFFLALFPRL